MFCVEQSNRWSREAEYFDTYDEACTYQAGLAQRGRSSSLYWVDPENTARSDEKLTTSCCGDPKVLGGRCFNCGCWLIDEEELLARDLEDMAEGEFNRWVKSLEDDNY